MTIDKLRAQVTGSIWQAIAQSGVDLSAVPHDQQEKLVSKIVDNVLESVDALLEEEDEAPLLDDLDDEQDERLLWQGRPFMSIVEHYAVTSERLKIVRGLLSRDVENYELIRIQDIDFKQGMSDRVFGLGDITILGHDPSDPKTVLRNVREPEKVYEILRRAWLEARKRHGLQFREYM